MAKNKQDTSGGKKGNFLIIALLVLIIAGMSAAMGYIFLEMKKLKTEGVVVTQAPAELPSPDYVNLEPFTVSLTPTENESDRVLYVGLTLKVNDKQTKEAIEKYLPEIRSRLLLLFSKQKSDSISTDEGKTNLINDIKKTLSLPSAGVQPIVVNDVLFNAFIIR